MAKVMITCECGCSHGLEYGGGKVDKALLTRTCFKCQRVIHLKVDDDFQTVAEAGIEKPVEQPAPKKRGRKPKPK